MRIYLLDQVLRFFLAVLTARWCLMFYSVSQQVTRYFISGSPDHLLWLNAYSFGVFILRITALRDSWKSVWRGVLCEYIFAGSAQVSPASVDLPLSKQRFPACDEGLTDLSYTGSWPLVEIVSGLVSKNVTKPHTEATSGAASHFADVIRRGLYHPRAPHFPVEVVERYRLVPYTQCPLTG